MSLQPELNRAESLGVIEADALFLLRDTSREAVAAFSANVTSHGGEVLYANEEIGYLHARLTLQAIETLGHDPAVDASAFDGSLRTAYRDGLYRRPRIFAPPTESTFVSNKAPLLDVGAMQIGSPIFGATALGFADWVRDHPTYDGRGTTVVNVEGLPELNAPSLRLSLSADGDLVPKLSRVFTTQVPFADGRFLKPIAVKTDSYGFFASDGLRYRAPQPGNYLFQMQELSDAGFYVAAGSHYGVLWKSGERQAWVDTSGNGDFSDERPVGDYNKMHEIGLLPHSAPLPKPGYHDYEGLSNLPLAFAIYFDPNTGLPKLISGSSGHATMTAGEIAGDHFAWGEAGSAAPNARLDALFYLPRHDESPHVSELLEGIIEAATDQGSDLFASSTVLDTLGELPSGFVHQVLERVVAVMEKPQFWGAGNSYTMTASVEGGIGRRTSSVGAYVSKDTVRILDGYTTAREDWVMPYSYGPSQSGAMKPDFVAPSLAVVPVTAAYGPNDHAPAAARLPLGFIQGGGTSDAAPTAASAAATLISAAKQASIPHTAVRINWALKAGARYLTDWPAQSQGAGLINLPAAWKMLTLAAARPEWRIDPQIEVRAPLKTRWADVTGQTVGDGLYEREGWKAGDQGERTITIRRKAGPGEAIRYGLRWLGNDGTFRLLNDTANGLELSKDKAAAIKLRIEPATPGAHSAILELLDAETEAPVSWIMCTVVASIQPSGENASDTSHREFLSAGHHFVAVPAHTQVLRIETEDISGSSMTTFNPPLGVEPGYDYGAELQVGASAANFWRIKAARNALLFTRPQRGVWEFVTMEPDGLSALEYHSDGKRREPKDNDYKFSVTVLSAQIDARVVGEKVLVGAKNLQAGLEGARLRVESGIEQRMTLDSSHNIVPIDVPEGSTALWLRGKSVSTGRPVPLWIYKWDTTQQGTPRKGDCALLEIPFEAREDVLLPAPQAGPWKIQVDKEDLKDGPVELEVIVTNPVYGTPVLGPLESRKSGESWQESLPVPSAPSATEDHRAFLVQLEDVADEERERAELPPEIATWTIAVGTAIVPPNREPNRTAKRAQ